MPLLTSLLMTVATLAADGWCYESARVTAYVRSESGPLTADGTPIWTDEPIAAASYDIPLQSIVRIRDLGEFRIADRGGGLGNYAWIDVAVWTRAEAYALTSVREACISPPVGATYGR